MEKVEKILDELRERKGFEVLFQIDKDILDDIKEAIHNIIAE